MKHSNRTSYEKCYVAFLDILGFKDMVKKNDSEILSIFEMLNDKESLLIAFSPAYDLDDPDKKHEQYANALRSVSFYIMSDSVVVSVPSRRQYALKALVTACLFLQCRLYNLDTPILLRGAIAEGEYYQEGTIAFGPALVDAYMYEENYSKYPRIILSGELLKSCDCTDSVIPMLYLDEKDHYYYVDCLKEHLGEDRTTNERGKFRAFIDKHLDSYESLSIRDKYMWLDKEYKRIVVDGSKCSDGSEVVLLDE